MFSTVSEAKTWFCPSCLKQSLPFMELDNFEFSKTQNATSNNLLNKNILASTIRKTLNLNSLSTSLNDHKINCDYYDLDNFKKLTNSEINKNCFSIFHSNISSLQGNFEKLELLLHQLNFKFDVISLSETWNPLTSNTTFIPNTIPGYQNYIGQTGSTMKSGCGFFIANKINFIPRKDLDKQFYNQVNEFECKWIEIINCNKPNSLIATIYRHPSKNDDAFLDYLKTTLNTLKKEKKLIFLTGDFNFNLLNYEKSKEVSEFLNILYSNFLQPYIIHPTRIVNNAKPFINRQYLCKHYRTYPY